MRIKVRFQSDGEVFLPVHYNYIVQSFIYAHLNPVLKNIVHEIGIPYRKRTYKLFTFSIIFPKSYRRVNKTLIMTPPLDLYISAYDDNILESFALSLMRKKEVRLGRNILSLEAIMVILPPEHESEVTIKTISPITTYSTFERQDKKYVHYYSPLEGEFKKKLHDNLRRKYEAIYGTKPEEKDDYFDIIPVEVAENPSIIYYKNYLIKGWKGVFKLKASPAYFRLSYLTGLGSRNSQGFGMWKPIEPRTEQWRELEV